MTSPSVNIAGMTTLASLSAVLSRAALCVTVDSVVYELAQTVGAPAVVLAGPSPTEHTISGRVTPIIVNRMNDDLRHAINECRAPKFGGAGCLDYSCPMSGLRDVEVADAIAAVDEILSRNASKDSRGSQ